MMAAPRRRFQQGQYFSVPLTNGMFAHGYFTEVDNGQMYLTAIHRLVTRTAEPPADIEDVPLAIPNLRISTAEFRRMKPHEEPYLGKRWILTNRIHTGEVAPLERYFILGSNSNPRVWDVLRRESPRPATEEERARMEPVGFDIPPGTRVAIERALAEVEPRD